MHDVAYKASAKRGGGQNARLEMNDQVPPNLRAIRILEVLSKLNNAPTPTELNAGPGWPKQTVHRLCQTLITAGILEEHDQRLYPGQRANHLATGLANRAAGRNACALPLYSQRQALYGKP